MNPNVLDTVRDALRHGGNAMTADEVTARARPLERITVVRALGELVRQGQAELHPCGEPRRYQSIRPTGFALHGQPPQREQKPVAPKPGAVAPKPKPIKAVAAPPAKPPTLAEQILELLRISRTALTIAQIAHRLKADPERVENLLEYIQVPAGTVERLQHIKAYRIPRTEDLA